VGGDNCAGGQEKTTRGRDGDSRGEALAVVTTEISMPAILHQAAPPKNAQAIWNFSAPRSATTTRAGAYMKACGAFFGGREENRNGEEREEREKTPQTTTKKKDNKKKTTPPPTAGGEGLSRGDARPRPMSGGNAKARHMAAIGMLYDYW